MKLRIALEECFDGWKGDISDEWKALVADVELRFQDVDSSLTLDPWEPIFPTRKGNRFPGARSDAHIFRTLDAISPASVRVVVLGQDPYPNPSQATGRAFEQGDLDAWPEDGSFVALSLRRIVQAAAFAQTKRLAFLAGDGAWPEVPQSIRDGTLKMSARPRGLFDAWQKRGVLFLNTGLTLSRFDSKADPSHQFDGHLPIWFPVVSALMQGLAALGNPLVFMLWGGKAKAAFRDAGVRQAARAAGTWKSKVDTVENSHPAYPRLNKSPVNFYDADRNPFINANVALQRMGASKIRW
jgi:uracil-DNA glycosylase